MNVVSLEHLRSQNGVRYFSPRDGTLGPLMAAIDFNELDDRFAKLKTVMLGVSMDHRLSHGEVRDRTACCGKRITKAAGKSAFSVPRSRLTGRAGCATRCMA